MEFPKVNPFLKHKNWPVVQLILDKIPHEYDVVIVGGAVRDVLLGRPVGDLDVATSMPMELMQGLFPKVINVGKNFGILRILHQGGEVELAMFRAETGYSDHRRPDQIRASTLLEDIRRRDFTMNALMYNLRTQEWIDQVHGLSDIASRQIRCVGVPKDRFQEDALRMLRALRFMSQLNFDLEKQTAKALSEHISDLQFISRERRREEFEKLLKGPWMLKSLQQGQILGVWSALFQKDIFFQEQHFASVQSPKDAEELKIRWADFLVQLFLQADVTWSSIENMLSFSRHEKNFFQEIFKCLLQREYLKKQRLGPLLVWSSAEVGSYLASFWSKQDSWWKEFLEQHQRQLSSLPLPWVKATDLISEFQGRKLGQILEELYYLQLEGKVHSKDQAIQWALSQRSKE